MEQNNQKFSKRRYKLGDISRELGIKKSVIRTWEQECGAVRDDGIYTHSDMLRFAQLKDLIYNQQCSLRDALDRLTIQCVSTQQACGNIQHPGHVQEEPMIQEHEEKVHAMDVSQPTSDQDITASHDCASPTDEQDHNVSPARTVNFDPIVVSQNQVEQVQPCKKHEELRTKLEDLREQLITLKGRLHI